MSDPISDESEQVAYSSKHPHDEDPIIDADGRCLICTRYVFDDERQRIIGLCESVGIDALPDSLPSQWGHDTVRRVRVLIARLDAAESKLAAAEQRIRELEAEHGGDGANDLSAVLAIRQNELARAEAVIEAVGDLETAWSGLDEMTVTALPGHSVMEFFEAKTKLNEALAAYDRALSTTPEERGE